MVWVVITVSVTFYSGELVVATGCRGACSEGRLGSVNGSRVVPL